MSATEAQGFTPAERAALDRATVPAMRAGFAADILSAASAGARVAPRRTSRGGWYRPGRTMIAVGALALASATAAATGMLGKLPIAIPGITRTVEAPVEKPKPVRLAKPRVPEARPQALASAPVAEVPPVALTPREERQIRRQQRIALGLPVRKGPPPLVRRAIAARLQAMPADKRAAVMAEWRRIKALPQPERKAAIAQLKADFLAKNPGVAAKREQRMELRSARAAASGQPLPAPTPVPGAAWGNGNPQLTPEERAHRREAWQQWRAQRRAWRMRQQNGLQPQPQ